VFCCRKVLPLDEYASYFENIDPVSRYKMWTTKQELVKSSYPRKLVPSYNITADRVKAVFVVSDPVDWGRDIQVIFFQLYYYGNHNEPVNVFVFNWANGMQIYVVNKD
jgi:hypothetical protein